MIIGEEVELVEKIPNIDATQRVHLRKWQHTWESAIVRFRGRKGEAVTGLRELVGGLLWDKPANVGYLLIFFFGVDSHRHIVIS